MMSSASCCFEPGYCKWGADLTDNLGHKKRLTGSDLVRSEGPPYFILLSFLYLGPKWSEKDLKLVTEIINPLRSVYQGHRVRE